MYKNSFVAAVKNSEGKILREFNGKVELPLYEEYSVLLKNKNSRRAVATVSIDGESVTGDKRLIIDPWSDFSLERFLKKGNLRNGRKFQLVPASDPRIEDGDHPELGIVEVEFTLEKENKYVNYTTSPHYKWSRPYHDVYPRSRIYSLGGSCQTGKSRAASISTTSMALSNEQCATSSSALFNSVGTAEGSRSTQQFRHGSIEQLEDSSTIIRLRIMASNSRGTIQDTRSKYCSNCGTKIKLRDNYCSSCGIKR